MNPKLQVASTKQPVIYSDFTNNFNKLPFSDDLALVNNTNAVKQAIINIVKTNLGERLYDDTIGSPSQYGLFELSDPLMATVIPTAVKDALVRNEPRAQIISVNINPNPDGNNYEVQIVFLTNNSPNPQAVDVIINRIR